MASDQITHRKASLSAQIHDGGFLVTAHSGRDGANRQTSASDLSYPMSPQSFAGTIEHWAHLLGERDPKALRALVNRLIVHRAGM
jgi:hypothetical protein